MDVSKLKVTCTRAGELLLQWKQLQVRSTRLMQWGGVCCCLNVPPPPHRPTSLHTCPAFQEEASSDWSSAVNMLQRLPVRVGLMMRGEGGWTAVFSVCALLG